MCINIHIEYYSMHIIEVYVKICNNFALIKYVKTLKCFHNSRFIVFKLLKNQTKYSKKHYYQIK